MRSAKKIYSYILEAYNQLYASAVPSVSFDELSASCRTYVDYNENEYTFDEPLTEDEREIKQLRKKINFYAYWIPQEKYQEICNAIEKKYRLKNLESSSFRFHAYLGCGPTSSIDRWLEEHPEYTYSDFVKMANEMGYSDLPKPKGFVNDEFEKQYC